MRKLLSIMALFVISLLTVSMVSAAPSTLGGLNTSYGSVKIEVNDEKDDSTLLSVEEGEELDVEVELAIGSDDADATYDMDGNPDYVPGDLTARNIEVEARLSGYEDKDVVENVLVSKVTEGTEKTYELFVESPSHSVEIADVSFSPSLTVKAGRSLLATVLLENVGEENEEDVKVTVAVPDLGLSASEYVDELNADDREDVDEMFLQIPADTPAGDYEVKVTAQYDDLDESVTETYTLKVLANEFLVPKTGKLVLAVGPEMQTVAAGKTASYAVALTNEGSASKAYTLEVATGDWATASVSESLVVLEPGKNKVVYVDVAAKEDATAGEHLASVTVKSGSDVLETVVLKANVVQDAGADGSASLRNGLEIALIVLVVLLVLMGLVIGFSRLRKDD